MMGLFFDRLGEFLTRTLGENDFTPIEKTVLDPVWVGTLALDGHMYSILS